MAASDAESTAAPVTDEAAPEQTEAGAPSEAEGPWRPPPAQPLRIGASILMIAASAALYGYLLSAFWSSPILGIHDRVPYPAYALIGADRDQVYTRGSKLILMGCKLGELVAREGAKVTAVNHDQRRLLHVLCAICGAVLIL